MTEIAPDRSEGGRCISVHWSLPVQCVLPGTHWENWHETWRPETDNRLRYRRAYGIFRTEELIDGEWTLLDIPPPVNERDELLAKLTEAEADRDRARDAAVALEQENARLSAAVWRVGELCEDASAIDNRPPVSMIRAALDGGEAL